MIRALLTCLSLLLISNPALASTAEPALEPAEERQLNLVPLPDVRMPVKNMDEAAVKTGRGLNPFLKVGPLAIGIPLGVSGVSIVATVPIAISLGDSITANAMYRAGISLMGGGLAAALTFNILARTLRFFLDAGKWQKDIGFLVAGAAMAVGGYIFVGLAGRATLTGVWPDGAIAAAFVGGATLWGVGLTIMIIDTLTIASKDNDPALVSLPGRPQVQFAGFYAAPTERGGAAGVVFRW